MRVAIIKKGISITGIMNEGMFEIILNFVEESKCKVEFKDYSTKALITGNDKQLNNFIKLWDN